VVLQKINLAEDSKAPLQLFGILFFFYIDSCPKLRLFCPYQSSLGTVHKRRPQSGGGKFVQCGHFSDKGGSSDAAVQTFWRKNFGFFKNYGVSARTMGG